MARDLKNRSNEFLGLDQKFWMIQETGGYGDAATGGLVPTSAGAFEHTTGNIQFNIPREDGTSRSGRSVVYRLSGKREVKVTMETYIIPGTPDGSNHPTLPDTHLLLLSVFGAIDESDPTKKVYKLGSSAATSIRMLEEGTHFSRLASGVVMDSVTFSLPGDGKAMMKFEGFGQDVKVAGQALLANDVTASNDLPVETGMGGRYELGAYVDVIDGTDGSTRKAASRKITAIVGDTLTVDGAAITATTGDYVIGAAPDFVADSGEHALIGLQGTFQTTLLGTVDCELISAEISLKNNYTQKNFLYGTSKICGYIPDKRRSVSVKLEVLLSQKNFDFYMNNKKFLADNLTITLAPSDIPSPMDSATGRTVSFKFPKVEFNVPNLEQPSDGYVKLTLEGTAMAVDANTLNTEMTLEIA
jgi:hypothetical protein